MAHDHATRSRVRAKYVQGMPLTSAADACEVPYNTARAWKRTAAADGDDWDVSRAARRMTKSGVAEMANRVLEDLSEQFLVTIEVLKEDKKMDAERRSRILVQLMDGYNKAISASTRALPNANRLAVAMDVVRFLSTLIGERHPSLRGAFLEAVEGAGDALVREFGGEGA